MQRAVNAIFGEGEEDVRSTRDMVRVAQTRWCVVRKAKKSATAQPVQPIIRRGSKKVRKRAQRNDAAAAAYAYAVRETRRACALRSATRLRYKTEVRCRCVRQIRAASAGAAMMPRADMRYAAPRARRGARWRRDGATARRRKRAAITSDVRALSASEFFADGVAARCASLTCYGTLIAA
jgi:hypothetical protein